MVCPLTLAHQLTKWGETMQIELQEHMEPADNRPTPFEIGKCYLIRTVTNYSVGRMKETVGSFLVLSDASWIADTGRFSDALKSGELNAVEPYHGDVILSAGAIVDATEWRHPLPEEKK